MLLPTPQTVPREPSALLWRYGCAVVGVILATLIRVWLHPLLGDLYPFSTFFVAAMVTAWYAGFGPALFSLGLGCLSATYYFVPRANSLDPIGAPHFLGMGVYLFVGLTSAALSESLRRARYAAERAQQAVKGQAQQLRAANEETKAANEQLQRQRDELQRLNEQLQDERQRLAFLAEASRILATSLDYQATLTHLARLVVPHMADWCAVDIVAEDGVPRRLAVAHIDPAKVTLAEELQRRFPDDRDAPHGVPQVLRSGCSDFMTEIPDSLLVSSAKGAEHLQILRDLGLKSYLCVPLRARGRTLGVISFVSAESGRRYGTNDVAFAEDLAHRAAVAIDNAQLYREAQEADRQKDHFLAILGHELRNPLSTISNALHLLKQSAIDPSMVRQREIMQRQVKQLTRLTDDLLDITRISQGRVLLKPERLNLFQLVCESTEDCRGVYEEAGLTLSLEVPDGAIWVEGDPARLSQVVGNLLRNAAKFTDPGGRIIVRLELDGQWATVAVRDTGIGIAAEMLPHVFDTFAQVEDSRHRSRGGLGLGLALVKGLVALHRGDVSAASDGPGHGSEFTVRLPRVTEGVGAR
jgi:signal transduction histidine kinase